MISVQGILLCQWGVRVFMPKQHKQHIYVPDDDIFEMLCGRDANKVSRASFFNAVKFSVFASHEFCGTCYKIYQKAWWELAQQELQRLDKLRNLL